MRCRLIYAVRAGTCRNDDEMLVGHVQVIYALSTQDISGDGYWFWGSGR